MADQFLSTDDNKVIELELFRNMIEQRIRHLKIEKSRGENQAETSEAVAEHEAEPSETVAIRTDDDQFDLDKILDKYAKDLVVDDIEHLPELEKDLKDVRKRIEGYKKEAQGVRQKLIDYAPKTFDQSEEAEEEEEDSSNYEERLRKFLRPWKVIAFENRKEGKKTLSELIRQLDRSDEEGGIAFDSTRALAVDFGTRLSRRIADYFLLFTDSEAKEMAARTRASLKTIRSVGLEKENSIVTRMFVSLIELVDGGIKDEKGTSVGTASLEDVWYSLRENRLLGSIFYKVLFLEIAFCCPCFAEMLDNQELVLLGVFLRGSFKEKMSKLSLEINELKEMEIEPSEGEDLKRNELKETFYLKIKEMWNQFEFWS